jgi:hypothetical protein
VRAAVTLNSEGSVQHFHAAIEPGRDALDLHQCRNSTLGGIDPNKRRMSQLNPSNLLPRSPAGADRTPGWLAYCAWAREVVVPTQPSSTSKSSEHAKRD